MPLTLELFGGFHLLDTERGTVRVPDRRARALIAYLALAERPVPRLALAELLCAEGDEQDQRTALRQAVYVARKATAQPDLVVGVEDQIGLNEALLVSDARCFQAAIARGDSESLREAVELYRGPLLAGERSPSAAFEDWLSGRRSELLEQVTRALLALAESSEAASEHDQALGLARRALTLDPLREDARRQVMRSLAALGQRAAALREYEIGRQLLADELQVSPDDDTEMLRGAISRGKETLANGLSALTTSHRYAVAGGASPPDRAGRGAPRPVGMTIDVRRARAPRRSAAAAAALLLIIAVGVATWWYSARPQPPATASAPPAGATVAKAVLPLPDKPSIAVLPFENLSGEERYERLADGITEDVITDLSRFRALLVIARSSTEVYEDQAVDVRQVARDLGVHYVLEGSLQIEGDHVRIAAQLIDGTTGNHVWAERYDRPLDGLFAVQDEVTKKIAGTLAPSMGGVLTRAGRGIARRKPPENLQAYENYLLGIEHKHRFTEEDIQKALELLTRATELDPGLARAYVGLAAAYDVALGSGWTASRDDALQSMSKALRTALALDPSDGQAHLLLGIYYVYVGALEQALAAFEKALSLNPNDADLLVMTGAMLPYVGRPEQASEVAARAARLNPNYPEWYKLNLMLAYFYAGKYDRALALTRSNLNPSVWDYVYRPLTYAHLGRDADAATAAAQLLGVYPDHSAERFLSDAGTFARDVELNRFLDGHRMAGLPLCSTEEQLAAYPDIERLEECEAQRAGG